MGEVYPSHDMRLERDVALKPANGPRYGHIARAALRTGGEARRAARISKLDYRTGARTLWREFGPTDAAGIAGFDSIAMTPSGRGYSDRIATIGCTDAARRAGARLARSAISTAIAQPAA